jgi:non-specific serine/threonine protein kinase
VYCQLTKEQVQLYQSIVNELQGTLAKVDPKERRGVVLKSILQLKQICNHPAQCMGVGEYAPSKSGKFLRLQELCAEIQSRQEKVLVFTQFSEIIPHLQSYLEEIFGRKGLQLHGGTSMKDRQSAVELFQNKEGPPFFILSLKAGGTGLTLTEASHVIHFDRWWNPAVENQATDRAFRIGQKKNVLVHRFITQGTIEEKIDEMILSKKKIATELLASSDEVRMTEMSDDELLNLVTLDLNKAIM